MRGWRAGGDVRLQKARSGTQILFIHFVHGSHTQLIFKARLVTDPGQEETIGALAAPETTDSPRQPAAPAE